MSAAPLKVLVIDDEPPIRKLLRMGLSTQGYAVLEAPNAKTALDLLAESAEGVGYLLKDRVGDIEEFATAVARVADGGSALDPEVVSHLVGRHRADDPLSQLTAREREVLQMLAEGRSAKDIAVTLAVSIKTVETHRKNIMDKLDIHSVAELTKYAIREGLTHLE